MNCRFYLSRGYSGGIESNFWWMFDLINYSENYMITSSHKNMGSMNYFYSGSYIFMKGPGTITSISNKYFSFDGEKQRESERETVIFIFFSYQRNSSKYRLHWLINGWNSEINQRNGTKIKNFQYSRIRPCLREIIFSGGAEEGYANSYGIIP
jgi:hypothetical protein